MKVTRAQCRTETTACFAWIKNKNRPLLGSVIIGACLDNRFPIVRSVDSVGLHC